MSEKIANINLANEFGLDAYNVERLYDKLKSVNEEIETNFAQLIKESSKSLDPRLALEDYYTESDQEWALFDQLNKLYPGTFGIVLSEACDDTYADEFTFTNLLEACYNYIINNIVSEEEFLDDFMVRVDVRNKQINTNLEQDKEQTKELINNQSKKPSTI